MAKNRQTIKIFQRVLVCILHILALDTEKVQEQGWLSLGSEGLQTGTKAGGLFRLARAASLMCLE